VSIHFDDSRWETLKKNYEAWWDHTLERPLIAVRLSGHDPGRPQPKAPVLSQATALDLSYTAEEIIDRLDYELSKLEFLGDAYPYVNMDCMGPGVLSAFLGAIPDNSTGRIWFHPTEEKELKDLHFAYDPDNIWFRRVKDLYHAANQRWHGKVVMGMVDLGGVLDTLAVFRGTDNLLFDLYDEPEEVKRLVGELHQLWMRYYDELCGILEECNQGYTDWSRIFSAKRSYVIQSDFSFMISNEMFREFALDELKQCTEELPHTLYHLDGPGEIKHLDDLLKLEQLNAVQWVPGAGAPDQTHWPEIYQKIHQAGKGIQLWDGYQCIETVGSQIGTYRGIHHFHMEGDGDLKDLEYHQNMLKKFGVNP
jgi:hypothetical protein